MALEHGPHVDAQRYVIIFYALAQRRGLDHILVIVVGRHVVARCLAQALQDLLALQDLAHGERAEPVEVDYALAAVLRPHVALGPFSDVAVQAHGCEVASRHQIHDVAVGNEVGKGQRARVGVIHQLAEAHREGAYVCRHEEVGAAGCLRAALHGAIVHGPHLVGVVTEVGCRARVVEREHAADEQRTLVVACRERSAEGGAGLAVRHVAVGKEHALRGCEPVAQLAGLAHEAVLHLHAVDDGRAVGNDRVFADHARAYEHAGLGRAHDGAVAYACGAVNLAEVVDNGVRDLLCVDDLHPVAYGSRLGHRALNVFSHEALHGRAEGGVARVLHHEGGDLARQAVERHHVAVAHLVEHRYVVALAEGGIEPSQNVFKKFSMYFFI